jgi:hypothetical protein
MRFDVPRDARIKYFKALSTMKVQSEWSSPKSADLSLVSRNISDTVLTFVVLSIYLTEVWQRGAVCTMHPNHSFVNAIFGIFSY